MKMYLFYSSSKHVNLDMLITLRSCSEDCSNLGGEAQENTGMCLAPQAVNSRCHPETTSLPPTWDAHTTLMHIWIKSRVICSGHVIKVLGRDRDINIKWAFISCVSLHAHTDMCTSIISYFGCCYIAGFILHSSNSRGRVTFKVSWPFSQMKV